MRIASVPAAVALVVSLAFGLASDRANAAPQGLPDQPLDLELKAADIRNVLALLGEVSGRKVTLDPCVQGHIDVRLKNTPLPLVYDALAMKLGLVYEDTSAGIQVRCTNGITSPKPERKVTISEKDTELSVVAAHVASSAGLAGVDYKATSKPKITVTLEDVRLSTVMSALSDATGLKVTVIADRLTITE